MGKKTYIKPEIEVIGMETPAILLDGSSTGFSVYDQISGRGEF